MYVPDPGNFGPKISGCICHNPDDSGPAADVYVAVRTIFGGVVGRLYAAAQPKLQKNLDCFRMYAGQF